MTRSALRSRLTRMVRRGMVSRPGGGLALAQIASAKTDADAYEIYCKWAGIAVPVVAEPPYPISTLLT